MDGNRNSDNRSDKSQWDRWNSDASNSSYYNQPVHRPYGQAFSYASFIMGMLSVTIGCCGLSIPLSALGVLFALLAHRKGRRMNSTAKSGLVLSCIGAVLGVCLAVYSFLAMPGIMKQFQALSQSQSEASPYGELLNRYYDYLSDYYGIPAEE